MLLQIVASLCCLAIGANGSGTSEVSVSKPHEGSYYSYGIDHDKYGAWYGTSHPHGYGGLGSGSGHGLYSDQNSLNHGAYGFGVYGSGYGHGDYSHATSYQNYNLKSYGGHKVLHGGYGVEHDDSSSYANFYLKNGHHGNLYGDHGHGYATSYQNFNMKSYGGQYEHKPIEYANVLHHYPEHGHDIIEHHEAFEPIYHSHEHDVLDHGLSLGHGIGSIDHTVDYGHHPYGHSHYADYGHTFGDYGTQEETPYSSGNYDFDPYSHSHDISFHGYSFE